MKTLLSGAVICSLFLFSGCSMKNSSDNSSEIIKVENIKHITDKGYYQNDSLSFFKDFTLPGYIGPSMAITEDEYFLNKYADKDLLFSNYGVKDRIYLLTGNQSIDSKDEKAKSYGFKNLQHMFEYLFIFYAKKDNYSLNKDLNKLKEKGLISSSAFSKQNLNKEHKDLLNNVFYTYLMFEKSPDIKILKEWSFTVDGKKITFTEEDYKPYAFTLVLMKELLLSNNKEGEKLYGLQ